MFGVDINKQDLGILRDLTESGKVMPALTKSYPLTETAAAYKYLETGHVRGKIKKKITSAITFKGYTVRASKEDPQYLIKSDTTDHLAMHEGVALKKLKGKQ